MEINNNLCIIDFFDFLPDPIMLHIFNKVSDIQSLTRCRAVSKRFNSLAPQSESIILRVDRVTSEPDPRSDSDSKKIILALLSPIIKCFKPFSSSPKKKPIFVNPTRPHDSPARILHGFESIRSLKIELPAGDLKLEKDSTVKWTANFGKTLQSCVILGFRNGGTPEADFGGNGLKTRVAWTISSLISASARHYMMLDVVKEQSDLTSLIVNDKDEEGTLIMDKTGLEECRKNDNTKDEELAINNSGGLGILCKSKRTKLPSVVMRIRHMPIMELNNGGKLEGATLVVIRPAASIGGGGGSKSGRGGGAKVETEEYRNDVRLAMDAFGSVKLYKDAVDKLLKSKSYVLEMNSF